MPHTVFTARRRTTTVALGLALLTSACSSAASHDPATATTPATQTAGQETPPGPSAPGGATPGALVLAAPARAYVDAVDAGNLDRLVGAFAPDGRVNDVDRPIVGRDAIRVWARNEVLGGRLDVLSVTAVEGGQDLLVHWAPSASAGWRAHYRFIMTADAITLADLQYA